MTTDRPEGSGGHKVSDNHSDNKQPECPLCQDLGLVTYKDGERQLVCQCRKGQDYLETRLKKKWDVV